MRLQYPFYTDDRVARVDLRIIARDLPEGAHIDVTDVQLQPGGDASGVFGNPRELGSIRQGPQYRNGAVHDGLEVVALSNSDRGAPTRLDVRGRSGSTRIGSFRFGALNGSATADGANHEASQGWGLTPVITERSDLTLRAHTDKRVHLRISWNDRGIGEYE